MKRFLAMFMLLVMAASPTLGQTVQDGFVRPPDVPAYVESFAGYATGTNQNIIGDGSNAWGGVMPVTANSCPDIPSTATGWVVAGATAPIASENKVRLQANFAFVAPDDPVRNWGAPGTSHLHTFFGSTTVNAYSTYASLRNRANQYSTGTPKKVASTTSGGPYNATGYWMPSLIKTNPFGNGKNYAIKIKDVTIYYVQAASEPSRARLVRCLRYVMGKNMDDPNDVQVAAELAAAQAATPGRYSAYNASLVNSGFTGWSCVNTSGTIVQTTSAQDYSKWLKTTAGVDPWGGACLSGYSLFANFNAPECYDGKNPWSPGGYKHFRYPIADNLAPLGRSCPNGWYRVPVLILTVHFTHKGFADYGNWRFSSDDAMQAKLTELGTPRTIANGESGHTDWMNGWDDTAMYGNAAGTVEGWLKHCIGVEGNQGHECNTSTINGTSSLQIGNAPDGTRTPQIQYPVYDTAVAADMFEIPTKWAGPTTIGNQ